MVNVPALAKPGMPLLGTTDLGVPAAAVPGFALADSVPSMGNYLARAQQWSNATALPAGKCVRIRLEAVQAKLFTFSFGPV